MTFLIGTDEAGYGPNLGPLIVSATLWEVPDRRGEESLHHRLSRVIADAPVAARETDRFAICDSKLLYRPGGGLERLELGLHPCLRQCRVGATTWRRCWRDLAPDLDPSLDGSPWYLGFDESLPIDARSETIDQLSERLADELRRTGVVLRAVRSVAVFPRSFNSSTQTLGGKGAVLSRTTTELVASLLCHCQGEVYVQCDKHGGRNRYGPVLQQCFPDVLIECHGESRRSSVYRWRREGLRVEASFVAGGERFLPAALASMASKYLRELAMRAFNRYWTDQLPELRPTAGYPVDAKRFLGEIIGRHRELGLDPLDLWRNR